MADPEHADGKQAQFALAALRRIEGGWLRLDGVACQLSCAYCISGQEKRAGPAALSPPTAEQRAQVLCDVERLLGATPADQQLHIVADDILELDGIFDVLAAYRRHGRHCHLTSPGLRLADPRFAEELSHFDVSLTITYLAHTANTYELLTGNPRAQSLVRAAIANLRRFKIKFGVNCVVTSHNVAEVTDVARDILFEEAQSGLTFPYFYLEQCLLDANPEAPLLFAPFADLRLQLTAVIGLIAGRPKAISVIDVPPCQLSAAQRSHPQLSIAFSHPPGFVANSPTPLIDAPQCSRCRYADRCSRVSRLYLRVDPGVEFSPLDGGEEERARGALDLRRDLARALGPITKRGVAQHFYVAQSLPTAPLSTESIAEAWTKHVARLRRGELPSLLSMYVHIPFCSQKCRYCIYHSLGDYAPGELELYLQRLKREIEYFSPIFRGIDFSTLYIGGGTPTVLSEAQLERLLGTLHAAFGFALGGERAFECNPHTASEDKVRLFERFGYNRVSFGVQSLDPEVLTRANRGYQTQERVVATMRMMQAARLRTNIDLIYGLPGDSEALTENSLRAVLGLRPSMVTIYYVSPFTPGPANPAPKLSIEDLATCLAPVAARAGYRLRQMSTCLVLGPWPDVEAHDRWSVEGRQAGRLHRYDDTTVEPFSLLGLGPTARSYIYGGLRYAADSYAVTTAFDPEALCARGRPVTISEEQERFVVTRLARSEGLVRDEFARCFGQPLAQAFGHKLEQMCAFGLLRDEGERLVQTSSDPLERFACESFFVPDAMVERAWVALRQSEDPAPAPVDHQRKQEMGVRVGAGHAEVRLVLVDYQEGQGCLHHAGRFAAYIPMKDNASRRRLGAVEEQLAAAFRSVFTAVVAAKEPCSLLELREGIVGHGNQLKLVLRTATSASPLPVRFTVYGSLASTEEAVAQPQQGTRSEKP